MDVCESKLSYVLLWTLKVIGAQIEMVWSIDCQMSILEFYSFLIFVKQTFPATQTVLLLCVSYLFYLQLNQAF